MYRVGQKIFYKKKETYIEDISKCGKNIVIANPFWDWDEEGLCSEIGVEYDLSYWIKININDNEISLN